MMSIDINFHPIFFDMLKVPEKELTKRMDTFGIYKQSPYPEAEIIHEMDFAKINQSCLMPLDLQKSHGTTIVTNQEVAKIVAAYPDRFIGFASVDPHDEKAPEKLRQAFVELNLSGLNLHLGRSQLLPTDDRLRKLYEVCLEFDKPIFFHAGLSWEPNSYSQYCEPVLYEAILIEYPELRVCLAHFAWPWVRETVMLLIKYPNLYTDTSMLYLNSFQEFFDQIFTQELTPLTIERNFPNQIMFGSNTPRFRAFKIKRALEQIPFKPDVLENILQNNAVRFLKGGDAHV